MREHALVVGASGGLGSAIGTELRRRGWTTSGIARRAAGREAVDQALACDVTDDDALRRAIAHAASSLGDPAALVWCAGTPVMGRTTAVPREAARATFATSFWAMDTAVRAVLPSMLDRGRGAILAVLSLAALRAVPHEAYYAAAKAAAARWLECLALEVEPAGVRVRCLYPGYVDTGFLERGGWWGMKAPAVRGSGETSVSVARAAVDLLESPHARAVVGWRERAIVLADRVAPGLYDRLLRRRAARA
jgi:2-hydroxycyclohexanecarboxyl-CoA dehydrogenase